MTCTDCREAGTALASGAPTEVVEALHAKCKGDTWCDCQHRTNPNMINLERVNHDREDHAAEEHQSGGGAATP
jgi:hypothetical protein